jgi:hypothetical protein
MNMKITNIVEVRDPTLGRLLVRKLTIGAMQDARDLLDKRLSGDEFVSEFFAWLARKVPDAEPVNAKSYEAGTTVTLSEFVALTPEARDRLAGDYLKQNEPLRRSSPTAVGPSSPLEEPTGKNTSERQTELLVRFVAEQSTSFKSSAEWFTRFLRGETVVAPWEDPKKLQRFGLLGPNDEITRAMKHVSDLSSDMHRILGGAGSPSHSPELLPPRPEYVYPKPQPDPAWETVERVSKMNEDTTRLVEFSQKQAELSQALINLSEVIAKNSDVALRVAKQSGEEASNATRLARASIWVTLIAIVVSAFTGLYSVHSAIQNSNQLSASAESRVQEEIRLLREISSYLKPRGENALTRPQTGGSAPNPGLPGNSPKGSR